MVGEAGLGWIETGMPFWAAAALASVNQNDSKAAGNRCKRQWQGRLVVDWRNIDRLQFVTLTRRNATESFPYSPS